ncbi:hypothetical protein LTR64_008450 [Lithohypha guttulata]|uniref:uncharacterized protein n=1 Tax=Lithohypha guttulata TaxID=1690604 RepID=UPI002DDEA9D5|nr:hypothetical protein LTR51_008506 [Lithohypha guttulata]
MPLQLFDILSQPHQSPGANTFTDVWIHPESMNSLMQAMLESNGSSSTTFGYANDNSFSPSVQLAFTDPMSALWDMTTIGQSSLHVR